MAVGGGTLSRRLEVVISGTSKGLSTAFGEAGRSADTFAGKMRRTGDRMVGAGKKMTMGVTLPLVAIGGAAFKTASDFETSMSKITGLVGIAGNEVNNMRADVLNLSKTTGKGAKELADGLFVVTSAGLRGQDAIDALTSSAQASAAGLGETADIARAVAGAMNAYGAANLDASKATDVIVATARAGNFETSQFAGALGRVLPFAKQAGASLEDVGGAVALLTRTNGDAAQSVTQVSALFRTFVTPSTQAEKILSKIGLTAGDVRDSIGEKGLAPTLKMLDKRLGGNREELGKLIGRAEGTSAAYQILDADSNTLAETFGVTADAAGLTTDAFGVVQETADFKVKKAMASLQASLIEIGTAITPVVAKIAEGFAKVAGAFTNLSPSAKKAVVTIAAIAAAVGPVLIIVGKLITVLALFANPIGLVVLAAAALAAGLVYLYRTSENARRVMDAAFKAIRAVVEPVIKNIKAVIETFIALINGDFRGAVEGVKSIIRNTFGALAGIIRAQISAAANAAKAIGAALWEGIKIGAAAVGTLAVWLMGKVKSGISALPGLMKTAFLAVGRAIVEGIKQGINDAWSGFLSWFGNKLGIGLVRWAKNKLGIKSPSSVFAEEVGKPIAEGIAKGFNQGIDNIRPRISADINTLTRDAIRQARTNLAGLASGLASMVADVARTRARATIGADETANIEAFEKERAARERLMIDRQRMELQEAVQSSRTRADRVRAQQALADFEADQHLARLEEMARAEEAANAKRAADGEAAAQKAADDAQSNINNLVAQFNTGTIGADDFHAQLTALLGAGFGENLGDEFGSAFALNFRTALDDVRSQVNEFARVTEQAFGLAPGSLVSPFDVRQGARSEVNRIQAEGFSKADENWRKSRGAFIRALQAAQKKNKKAKVNDFSNVKQWEVANPRPVKPTPLAAGGILRRAILAGEAGPEAVIPLTGSLGRNALARAMEDAGAQAGGGGMVINLTVHGVMAGDVREFAQRLKPELARVLTAGY